MWLPLLRPLLGTWPTTQACTLTGNQTGNSLVLRLALNPLSHTSQGCFKFLKNILFIFRARGREGDREGKKHQYISNISQLPLAHPHLGTWPTTQAWALPGNCTHSLLVCGIMSNPLSHTSQGELCYVLKFAVLEVARAGRLECLSWHHPAVVKARLSL